MSVRQAANSYQVAMDDPLHPEDEPRLLEIVREKERVGDKGSIAEAKRRAQSVQIAGYKPGGHFDQAADKMTRGRDNLGLPVDKLSAGFGQIDQALKDSFLIPESPLNPSSELSLTLFPEKPLLTWSQLTEAQQQPYREQAEKELIALFGLSEWRSLGSRAHDRQVQSRAQSLYGAAQKATTP